MVWPIIGVKSYVGETGKSMKAGDLTAPQKVIDVISRYTNNPLPRSMTSTATNVQEPLSPSSSPLLGPKCLLNERVAGGSNQSRIVVQYDGYGHLLEQRRHPAFVQERL